MPAQAAQQRERCTGPSPFAGTIRALGWAYRTSGLRHPGALSSLGWACVSPGPLGAAGVPQPVANWWRSHMITLAG